MRSPGGRRTLTAIPPTDPFVLTGRVAVFQPRPGLGDLIWHLPLIRALAASRPVTLITKPSTQAGALLDGDPAIERIVWFDRNPRVGRGRHDGPLGFLRLVATLQSCQADSCVLLHQGASLALAMRLAGIPNRYGYGYQAAQRRWLNRGPYLEGDVQFAEAAVQAGAYAGAAGFADLPEPSVRVDPSARAGMRMRLAGMAQPWTVLGAGCHGANRQWGADRFAALATQCLARGPGSVIVVAAAHEAALAQSIAAAAIPQERLHMAVGWALPVVAALLEEAAVFIGNDSGLMNLRAAVGRPATGLFGASGPLLHSRLIRAVIPPGGPRAGMDAITVDQVLRVVENTETLTT